MTPCDHCEIKGGQCDFTDIRCRLLASEILSLRPDLIQLPQTDQMKIEKATKSKAYYEANKERVRARQLTYYHATKKELKKPDIRPDILAIVATLKTAQAEELADRRARVREALA